MNRNELKQFLLDTFGHLDAPQTFGLTIYGEARGEPREGQIGVATVILERVDHHDWEGTDIKGVCLCPWQFSCFLSYSPELKEMKGIAQNWDACYEKSFVLQGCYGIAHGMIDGTIPRDADLHAAKCCQYVETRFRKYADANPGIATRWWAKMKMIKQLGRTEFYAAAT